MQSSIHGRDVPVRHIEVIKPVTTASVSTGVTEACTLDESIRSENVMEQALALSDNNSVISEISNEPYDRIQVAIRLRPLSDSERRQSKDETPRAWKIDSNASNMVPLSGMEHKEKRKSYSFDFIFDETQSTRHVYNDFCQHVVKSFYTGRNGTIFAYGNTGSGKTYTMGTSDEEGVIQMAVSDLFHDIESRSGSQYEYTIKVQYFEIYNEHVRDLLVVPVSRGGQTMGPHVPLLEKNGHVVVKGSQEEVTSAEHAVQLLVRGNQNRASTRTECNEQSSRSHAVFRLTLERRDNVTKVIRSSVLDLVDLAGSEKSFGCNTSARKREGGIINQSLLSLSRVIQALSLPKKKQPKHIGYRDSKLTRILQGSLAGEACTAVLCCASTARASYEETKSTLKFAACARLIACKPVVNDRIDPETLIAKLRGELEDTRLALVRLQERLDHGLCVIPEDSVVAADHSEITSTAHEEDTTSRSAQDKEPVAKAVSSTPETTDVTLDKESYPKELDDISDAVVDDSDASEVSYVIEVLEESDEPPVLEVFITPHEAVVANLGLREQLDDAEYREEELESKLKSANALVENLFAELKQARAFNEQLLERNGVMEVNIRQLKHFHTQKCTENENLMQQHLLLKFAVYIGLACCWSGLSEYFFATILFLWLSLEVFT